MLNRLLLPVPSRAAWQLALDAPGDGEHRWVETILLDCQVPLCISLGEPSYDAGVRRGLLVYACCIPKVMT